MKAKATARGPAFPSSASAPSARPVEPTSLEEAVRLIHDLADRLPSSTSFESADIARQIAEQVSSLHALRNTKGASAPESRSTLAPSSAGPSPDPKG